MSCLHNWSPRLSLYLKKKKRQVTIWRDSCAATMKRRGPSLPSNSAPLWVLGWSSKCLPVHLKSVSSDQLGTEEGPRATAPSRARFWRGRERFSKWPGLSLQSYTVKVQETGRHYFLSLQMSEGFQSHEENHLPSPVPLSLQSDSLTKCIHLSENVPP